MNYTGEKCAACGEVFTDTDDVVVCPECGSPHHRECYKAENKCANSDYHAEGKKWKRENDISDTLNNHAVQQAPVCPFCHFKNQPGESHCVRCGTELDNNSAENREQSFTPEEIVGKIMENEPDITQTYLGFNPNEDLGGATVKEVSQYVRSNTIYYIPIFKRIKDTGAKFSFNLTCLIFPYAYFANRRMWGWAILSAIVMVLLGLPAAILSMPSHMEGVEGVEQVISIVHAHKNILTDLSNICSFLEIIARAGFCMLGNFIYYKHVMRSLKKLRTECGGTMNPELIIAEGGVKPMNILFIFLIMLCFSGFALYLSFMFMR